MAQNVEPVKPVEYESEPSEYEDDEDEAEELYEKPYEYDTDPSEEEDDDGASAESDSEPDPPPPSAENPLPQIEEHDTDPSKEEDNDEASSESDSESDLTQDSKTPSSSKPAAAQNPLPQPSSDSDSDVSNPESMILDVKPKINGLKFSNGARKPRPQPSAGKRQGEEMEMGAEDSKKPPKKKLIMNLVDEMCAVGEGAEEWKKLDVEEAKIYMLKLGLEIKRADLRIRALKSRCRT